MSAAGSIGPGSGGAGGGGVLGGEVGPGKKPVIGLVGGIGAGKSTVAGAFGRAGCVVFDSDARAKALLQTEAVRAALVRWWGSRVLGADGQVSRPRVAEIVFADPAERARLEGLVHPILKQERAEVAARAAAEGARGLVVDAPLLLEAGLAGECDAVVFVESTREERLERVRATRGWDEAELSRREAAQWSLERKRAASGWVIRNTGATSEQELDEHARRVLGEIESAVGGTG